MKCIKSLSYILISFQLVLLCSCNDDIFIEELIVPVSDLCLSGNGDSVIVNIKSTEWMIASVENIQSYGNRNFIGIIYDEKGDRMYNYNVSLYSYGLKKGRMEFDDELNGFTISRYNDNELIIKVNENLTKDNFVFLIHVSDNYKTFTIKVTQTPATELVFDNITYNYIPNTCKNNYNYKTLYTVANYSDDALLVKVHIKEEIKRIYNFSSKSKNDLSNLFFTDSIPVPSGLINNEIFLGNHKLLFNGNQQNLPFEFENSPKDIYINKGMYLIRILYKYYSFSANYVISFRNKVTGKLRHLSGDISINIPTDDLTFKNEKLQDL